jgi:nucleotide-binding universal stress UspA family protein
MNTHIMNILLGYDGSHHAQAALTLLCNLYFEHQQAPKPRVTMLAIFTPLMAGDQGLLRDSMEQAHTFLENNGFQVNSDLVLGYPAEKIMEYSEQLKPDLIILGARGLRSAFGILLGGVAQQIVEYARCPVLVVRAPYKDTKQWMLVTDGSECSKKATLYLSRFPVPEGTRVHALNVLPPLPLQPPNEFYTRTYPIAPEVLPVYPSEPTEEMLKWQADEEIKGKTLIDETLAILTESGIESIGKLLRGDAAKEIINYAKNNHIDLIVCGSRGLSTFKGWLLGSVSRKLVHYSDCSVLIVKAH